MVNLRIIISKKVHINMVFEFGILGIMRNSINNLALLEGTTYIAVPGFKFS